MKNTMKWTAATLALGLVSVTAGCGGGSSDQGNASSAPGGSSASQKAVTLRYMTWNYADATKSTDAWIKDLKDKYNIVIDMQNLPTDQYATNLKTKLAANDLPDLFMTHGIANDLYMASEKLKVEPDQLSDLSDLKSVADFLPSLISEKKNNKAGKLFYVPVSTNVLGVIYNKKVFKDNGLALPTNIDEFTALCDKLKQAKVTPIAAPFKDSWTTQIIPFIAFGQYVNTKDATIKKKLADGSLTYTDIKDDVKKVLNVQSDWIQKGYFSNDFLGTDVNVASQMVGTGKAAMLINGTWQYKTVQDADPKAEIGFFALPLNAKGEKTVVPTTSNEGIVINAKTNNLKEARQAIDFFLSPENLTRVLADKNGIPTNNKVQVSSPFVKEVISVMDAGVVQPDFWGANGYYAPSNTTFQLDKEFQSLIAGGTTPDQFIAGYDKANAKALGK